MPVYKVKKDNSWRVVYRYVDWTGQQRQTSKCGFKTKREALAWEREQLIKMSGNLDMTFQSFVDSYYADIKNRIEPNTLSVKEHIIRTKILPYFGPQKMSQIMPKDIIAWQNMLLNYRDENNKPYSSCYLKTVHNQLSAIFNHAVKFYGLPSNPAAKVGNMGKENSKEKDFWTEDEYAKFADVMKDEPRYYYAFEMLYWCGIRVGELLALTPADFDFEREMVSITKTYYRLNGQDIIADPKTPKSNRVVQMPDFLAKEIKDYIGRIYGIGDHDRIFDVSRRTLSKVLARGAKKAGIKRIRIHDLRHSHISLLIDRGFSVVAIADRVGHASTDITFRYAHMFPSAQQDMATALSKIHGEEGKEASV